jgi:hypothetical protein
MCIVVFRTTTPAGERLGEMPSSAALSSPACLVPGDLGTGPRDAEQCTLVWTV